MPNLLQRLFPGQKEKRAPFAVELSSGMSNTFDNLFDRDNLNRFDDSLYLYIGVSMIAKRAAGIELELHRIKNQQGETEEITDHDVLDLFYNPNAFQTQRELMEVSVAHYLLSGDVFWYHDPVENTLFPLRPDYVEVVIAPDRKSIIAYEYRMGEVVRFKPEDITHIKNPHPKNLLRGAGVVRPASSRILTEMQANEYQAAYFQNYGRPDIMVFSTREVTPETAELNRRSWRKIFGGKATGKAAFFGDDVRDVKELNKSPKEMDFTGSLNFLRDDILAALRIPKAMVTSDDVNLSNAKEAYRMFLQEAVVPVMDAFIDAINNRMLTRIDDTLFFIFQDPTPNDRETMLKEATELKKAGIITANEARAMYEMDAVDGGDALQTAQNGLRVQEEAKAILRRRKLLRKRFLAREALLKTLETPKRQMNSLFPTKEMKQQYAKAFNDRVDRKAETMLDALLRYLSGLEERILATELTVNDFMDITEEKRVAKTELTPVLVRLYKEGGQQALNDIFREKADDVFFADEVLVAAVEARAAFFTESMTETTFEILKGKLVTGISNGDGPDTIASSIKEYFNTMKDGRAKTIARTETSFAISKATNDAYGQSSIVTGKEWISAGDAKVRPDHVENDGVIVAKFGAFPNGEEYPGHHSINCRCTLAPAV